LVGLEQIAEALQCLLLGHEHGSFVAVVGDYNLAVHAPNPTVAVIEGSTDNYTPAAEVEDDGLD
jgi:hypothetical protein